MPKAKFKEPCLNHKIKRTEHLEHTRQEKCHQLFAAYGIDPSQCDMSDPRPWRELCMKMAIDFIPGFQANKSGRAMENSFVSDRAVIKHYVAHREFRRIAGSIKSKEVIEEIAKVHKKTVKQVYAAFQRYNRHAQAYPDLYISCSFSDAGPNETPYSADSAKKVNPKYYEFSKE